MKKILAPEEFRKSLIELKSTKNIYLEGNISKVIDDGGDPEFSKYLKECISLDKEGRKKRLDLTKKLQSQNKELIESQDENKELMSEIKEALELAEEAKECALSDLDLVQKKKQFELIGMIVKIALSIIIGVGVLTTTLYIFSMYSGKDTQLIGNTWSNMFGILLTNAFSIVGTIMGVKYASENKNQEK